MATLELNVDVFDEFLAFDIASSTTRLLASMKSTPWLRALAGLCAEHSFMQSLRMALIYAGMPTKQLPIAQ